MSEMIERAAFNKAKPGDDLSVFMGYVEQDANSGCWLWSGPLTGKMGYGRFFRHGKQHQAHKWAYTRLRQVIPAGSYALHRCDTPCCVNPDHIFLGTLADNNADRDRKRRTATGEDNGQARLTLAAAEAIRASKEPTAVLAARFGVHIATVKRVRRGDYWRPQ